MGLVDYWPVLGLIGFAFLAVLVPPVKIRLTGAALRKQGVAKDEVSAWALAEAKKDRKNPAVEAIAAAADFVRACRGKES